MLAINVVRFFDANGFLFELLLFVAMLAFPLHRNQRFGLRVTASIALLSAVSSLWAEFVPESMFSNIARFIILVALTGLAIAVCWRLRLTQAVFYLVVAAAMQHFAFRGALIIESVIQHFFLDAAGVGVFAYPLALVPFYAIGYWLFAKPLNDQNTAEVGSNSILFLLVGMLLSVNVFTNVYDELDPDSGAGFYTMFSLLDLVTTVFLLALATQIVRRESAEQDSNILRHLMHQQKIQMKSSTETIELINVKTHDLKKQIMRLGDRIPKDEVDELKSLVGIYDSMVLSGNESLDILLAEKSLLCEKRGIRFDRIVDGKLLGFMRPGDIYSLFGNAIDNALDAVAEVKDTDQRYIAMKVRRSRGMLIIHIENSFEGERVFKGDLPLTTKGDKHYHGFGMRSIQMISEKYDGHMSALAVDGVFSVNVLLPLNGAD